MKRRSFLASLCALFVPLPKKPQPLTVQQVAREILRSHRIENAEQYSQYFQHFQGFNWQPAGAPALETGSRFGKAEHNPTHRLIIGGKEFIPS